MIELMQADLVFGSVEAVGDHNIGAAPSVSRLSTFQYTKRKPPRRQQLHDESTRHISGSVNFFPRRRPLSAKVKPKDFQRSDAV